MQMTRDLVKKIRDTKGIFQAKMGTIKDRNCKKPNRSRRDQGEMERIHRRTEQKRS